MKSKNYIVYTMAFIYVLFSYAVTISPGIMTFNDWFIVLVFNCVISIIAALLISDNRKILPLADLVILIYILFLISKTIAGMNRYMKIYHPQAPLAINIIITAALIFTLYCYSGVKAEKLAAPVCAIAFFILVMIVRLNITKANPSNLYIRSNSTRMRISNITLFDYIIPLAVILNSKHSLNRKKITAFIFLLTFALISVTVFVFSCISGNLLYSISPLQIAFQISSGSQIANFDAYYNFLLWFCYFASLILLMEAWRNVKTRFKYFNGTELFLIIPVVFLIDDMSETLWFILFIIAAGFMAMGKRKAGYYEKN